MRTPGPSSYNSDKSFKSTVEIGLAKYGRFGKERGGSFIARLIKEKKKIPGVGSY